MAAQAKFHDAVKRALIKEEWTITHDPLSLQFGIVDLYVDWGAEKLIAAQKGTQKIAVEIKSFLSPSLISTYHSALGQFLNYRLALRSEEPDRTLYLAVPMDTYEAFFKLEFTQLSIQENNLKLIVYHADREVIVEWKE